MFILQEGRSVQRPKRCDKHGDKDDDNSPKNVNNVKKKTTKKQEIVHYTSYVFERPQLVTLI